MHVLHKILVNINDVGETDKNAIRCYAEEGTEQYADRVYDWRITENAGRWKNVYPNNVLIASENLGLFIEMIQKSKQQQQDDIKYYLKRINELIGNGKNAYAEATLSDIVENSRQSVGYYLVKVGNLIAGIYYETSYFYNLHTYDTLINDDLIKTISQNPDDWALVLFDCHF